MKHDQSNLGGPALTSHLTLPDVERLVFFKTNLCHEGGERDYNDSDYTDRNHTDHDYNDTDQ